MKIGYVIAFKKGHNNYGTSLQAYALLKVIQNLGYHVEIIDYVKCLGIINKLEWCLNAVRAGEWKSVLSLFTGKVKMVVHNGSYAQNIALRTSAVDAYKRKKLVPYFNTYEGYEALHEGSKNYDAIIVGSDQVWTPMGLPTRFFNLLFVHDCVRKVAYASSFGVSNIPSFQKERTGSYLDRFYKIGVREQRGKEIVESLSHQTAQVVADPTLLLTSDEWRQEINDTISASSKKSKERAESGEYIFCYFLGKNQTARTAVLELKKKTGLKIITIRHMDEYVEQDEYFGDEAPYDVDPNDFVRFVSNASYVCTDSFHCTVFSIIFHRPFLTFYRYARTNKTGRNSRIDSLFQIAGIPREKIFSGNVFAIENVIDWETIDMKIAHLRKDSLTFLQKALD